MAQEAPPRPVAPPTKTLNNRKSMTWIDVLNGIMYLLLTGAAVYYGWIFGQKYALRYWMIVQALGATIREYIGKMIAYAKKASQNVQQVQ